MKGRRDAGPSTTEIKLRGDVDQLRRENARLKKVIAAAQLGATPTAPDTPAPELPGATPAAGPASSPEASASPADLQRKVEELEATRLRLGRIYFQQVETARRRGDQLQAVLGALAHPWDGESLRTQLQRMADAIRQHLGWRMVLVRLRDEGAEHLEAVAFAGVRPAVRAALEAENVPVREFTSWLRDEFRVGRSYFISHRHAFNKVLPAGHTAELGERGEGEWHPDDVLLVPLLDPERQPFGYLSVDDPADRMVPSRESVALLEVVAAHAVVAIGYDRAQRRTHARRRERDAASGQAREAAALKDGFVAEVARELRVPLAGIQAHAAALLETPGADPAPGRPLQAIHDEAGRLAALAGAMVALGRFDPAQARMRRETVDIGELVHEAVALLEPMAQAADVHLKVVGGIADTGVDADREQLRQLVLHLGGHASRVTPAGGTVTLHLEGDERTVVLRVEDTGGVLSAPELQRLLEDRPAVDAARVRTDSAVTGLAACRAIAAAHGGRIEAAATGAGTCFTVTLARHAGSRVILNAPEHWSAATGDVIRLAVEMVGEAMSAGVVSLMTVEPDGDLVIRAAIGLEPAVVRSTRVAAGSGVAGWVATHRRPVCVRPDDAAAEVRGSGRGSYRTGTFLSVPIEGGPALLGVLNVTDPSGGGPFRTEDASLLLALVDHVARAWRGSTGESDAASEDAGDPLRTVLQHLRENRGRTPRRVRLAHAVAREMQLAEHEVRMVGLAAAVHDVGMRAVSAGVDAAAPLTPHQRDAMRRHVAHGVGLLEPLEAIGSLRELVLHHHEWWNGSGYPRGLAGADIPAGARVLAVVDAFASMTEGRPHRAAMSKHAALNELVRQAGQQFDPAAVDALERALTQFRWDDATHGPDAAPSAGADPGR